MANRKNHFSGSWFLRMMFKRRIFLSLILMAGMLISCKRQSSTKPYGIMTSPFQNESQFIVETIVSDLAEQMYYAKQHRLPGHCTVTAAEKPGAPPDTAGFEIQIQMDSVRVPSGLNLDMQHPIWSPDSYEPVAKNLADALGLSPAASSGEDDTRLLAALTDGSGETIEAENETLSRALENDFTSPGLHEEAAVLLGAFALNEHAGHFCDIRVPISLATAHLAMAQFLEGTNAFGINGRIADATLLTLMNDETAALAQLDAVNTNTPAVAAFVRALRVNVTGDYRLPDDADQPTRLEREAKFCAMAGYATPTVAWQKLADRDKQTVDFVRIAGCEGYSVEMGNAMLQLALPLEWQEISRIYQRVQHKQLDKSELVDALNELPEGTFNHSGGAVHVAVIDWGLWASFFQHQMCQTIANDYNQLQNMLGLPDDATNFMGQMQTTLGGLRLYPFVQLSLDGDNAAPGVLSACDGLIAASPHLVPQDCWIAPSGPRPRSGFSFRPHFAEWFNHYPLPGTVFRFEWMTANLIASRHTNVLAFAETLHAMAPYDNNLNWYLFGRKYYQHNPTYDQVMDIYSNVMPYSVSAMIKAADASKDRPDQYEKLMLQAAAARPSLYYTLAQYALDHHDEDKAAQYFDKGCDEDPDSIAASYHAEWRVRYYLKKGQTQIARAIADEAADVYSAAGLRAEGVFQELTGNYDAAFQWYEKIEERYEDSADVVDFCVRYREETGSTRFEGELKKRLGRLFPNGIEKISLGDFHGPPDDGVVFRTDSDLLRAAGLKSGDVIVAVNGIRVHNQKQYTYGRSMEDKPEMDLIVWQGDGYHEVKASPPNHLFGVSIGDFRRN